MTMSFISPAHRLNTIRTGRTLSSDAAVHPLATQGQGAGTHRAGGMCLEPTDAIQFPLLTGLKLLLLTTRETTRWGVSYSPLTK